MGNVAVAGEPLPILVSGFQLCLLTKIIMWYDVGFDPIFWLHHSNVDRLLQLWSSRHPGVWVTEGHVKGGTITIPPNATVNDQTGSSVVSFSFACMFETNSHIGTSAGLVYFIGLTPFIQTTSGVVSNYWTSDYTRTTEILKYSYPEYDNIDITNTSAVKYAMTALTNNLYGNSDQLNAIRTLSTGAADPDSSRYFDWTARINVNQHALGASFAVLLFLGPVDCEPSTWQIGQCENFAGAVDSFASSHREDEIIIEGFVHLNRAIARLAPELASLEPDVVKPWLQDKLTWRVQKVSSSRSNDIRFSFFYHLVCWCVDIVRCVC